MRELVYYVAVSLDGFIADASGGFDAFSTDGDHMASALGEYADALPSHVLQALGIEPPGTHFDTVLMGWNTLQPALIAGIESPYLHLRQFVASRHERRLARDIRLTHDPMSTVRELKQAPGLDLWLCGGGALASSLITEIDRLILKRHPVVLQAGIPLFSSAESHVTRYTHERSTAFASGVSLEEYRRQR